MTNPSFPLWVQYVQTFIGPLATILAAGVAAFIAWRIGSGQIGIAQAQKDIADEQKDIASNKLKLDLFDRRYAYFAATRDFAASVVASGQLDMEKLSDFELATIGAEFLFGKDVLDLIESLKRNSLDLWAVNEELKTLPSGEERAETVKKVRAALSHNRAKYEEIERVFRPYLELSHIKGS